MRINKDSIESILGMLYILTQHLIKLYIYNINGMKLPCVFNSLENHKPYECVSWCICVISGAEFKPFNYEQPFCS